MQIILHPEKDSWKPLLQRPYVDNRHILESVQTILHAVKEHGDEAVRSFTRKFDGVELEDFRVTETEIKKAEAALSGNLKEAILQAQSNIIRFHERQFSKTEIIETMPGVACWRKNVPIEKVGLYIPGGTAPLFSTVLMLGLPAKLAGCKEITLCTPCDKDGAVHPAVLFTASIVGIHKIYKIGGAQAIAAMAFGTATIDPVYKIFGPGNQYVTMAKQIVQMQGIAIDMPAGPSEVCVIADETAEAAFVAADLLSQAEHGIDSQVLLVSNSREVVQKVQEELTRQLGLLPRKEIACKALTNSKAIVVKDIVEIIDLVNEYAPEHLIISCAQASALAGKISNAGSVFIGNYAPESVGDYASGTNHTLPTNGFAKAWSGVSIDSFIKKITYQQLSADGLNAIAGTVIAMAEAEGLQAHANAVKIRLTQNGNP